MATFINQLKAIRTINPDAQYRTGGSVETIEWLFGTEPISISDITTKADELQAADEAALAQKATDKASGKQKLKDLGLNDEEIKALTGA